MKPESLQALVDFEEKIKMKEELKELQKKGENGIRNCYITGDK